MGIRSIPPFPPPPPPVPKPHRAPRPPAARVEDELTSYDAMYDAWYLIVNLGTAVVRLSLPAVVACAAARFAILASIPVANHRIEYTARYDERGSRRARARAAPATGAGSPTVTARDCRSRSLVRRVTACCTAGVG